MRKNYRNPITAPAVLRKCDGIQVNHVGSGTLPAQFRNAAFELAAAMCDKTERLSMKSRRGKAKHLVTPGSLWPKIKVLHLGAKLPQLTFTSLEWLAKRQFVTMMESQQMHLILTAEFSKQVEAALKNTPMGRVRHDLRHVEDVHWLCNCTLYLQACQVCPLGI